MSRFLEDLKESNEFLNLLLDNVDAAVLIADENLTIHEFNASFLSLFQKPGEKGLSFGSTAGCQHCVEEGRACGETSACGGCQIRTALLETFTQNIPADRVRLDRVFYINGKPEKKHLRFSTRPIRYQGRNMILVILQDITELEQSRKALAEKQRLMDQDLASAAGVQQSLLPRACQQIGAVSAAWKFLPCSRVGGDLFNVLPAGEDHLVLYMLDAVGHGVSAALIAVAVSQYLHGPDVLATGRGPTPPGRVLASLDHMFPFERFDTYFTIACLALNTKTGEVAHASAGHPPPLLVTGKGDVRPLAQGGPAVGVLHDNPRCEERLRLAPGDKLVLYTDGMVESRGPDNEPFGTVRFIENLRRSAAGSPARMVEESFAAQRFFCHGTPPEDDVSLLAVEFPG